MIDQDINIYNELRNVSITNEAEVNKQFVLNYYQTIPKYYLLCNNKDVNSLVLNYSVGSGKTAAGLFIVLKNIDTYKKYTFVRPFVNNTVNKQLAINKNVIVIGSWVTITAVINELMKEEFGIITAHEVQQYKRLISSNIHEERLQGEAMKKHIYKRIESYIDFYGYQKFVNKCFPNLTTNNLTQDIDILLRAYEHNELVVDKDFQQRLTNSVILVDECQKLYSSQGMNSFGFTIMVLTKLAKQLNIKIVFLSGTIFNTSLAELVPIVNIMSEHTQNTYGNYNTPKGIFNDNDCLEQTELIDGYNTMVPTQKFINVAEQLLNEHYIYYNHSLLQNEQYVGKLFDISTNKSIQLKQTDISPNELVLKYNKRQHLPIEQHVGNICVMNKDNNVVKLLLYSCEVFGYQKQQYKQFLTKNKNNFDMDDDENDSTLSIHDVALPPTKDMLAHGIVKNSMNYIGKFLQLDNLKQYSTIGYNLVKICQQKCTHGEKVIVYHNKLFNFGIYQYMLILNTNGFVKYGESAKNSSICLHCGKTLEQHRLDLPKRLELGVCNEFSPIYYYYLIGSMKQSERDTLVSNVFNNPKNLYGELLSIMFVSDVAYSGISFLNTNNIILLSKISNISKWTQICARIIRTKSHVLLPPDKQYANIYTMVIHYPNEQKTFSTKFTYEQKYYIIRTLLNENIEQFVNNFHKKTIGWKLFNEPLTITSDETEHNKLVQLYTNDINNDINNIIDKYVKHYPTSTWMLDTFIKRIKDNTQSYTYLNMSKVSDTYIKKVLANNKNIWLYKYASDNTNTVYIYFKQPKTANIIPRVVIPYKSLENIPTDITVFYNLLDKLGKAQFLIHKRLYMMKILKFIGKKYDMLTNQKIWWDTIYELHDEYYDTDEQHFIDNHYSKHRDISKMVGFYYNDVIVMKDGTTKRIPYSFPIYNGWDDIPYKFRISSTAITTTAPWYLHVNISKKQTSTTNKISKGITCVSFDYSELHKYLHINKSDYANKNELCVALIQVLIDKQHNNMDDRNLYTPFEK